MLLVDPFQMGAVSFITLMFLTAFAFDMSRIQTIRKGNDSRDLTNLVTSTRI